MTNFGYSTEVVKEGKQSLTFHKTNGYIYFALNTGGEMYKLLKNGFTFWIYSTVGLNGSGASNFVDGNGVIENLGVDNIVKIKKTAAISRAESEKEIAMAHSQILKMLKMLQIFIWHGAMLLQKVFCILQG